MHRCATDLGFLGFAVVEVPARATFCDILGLLRLYTSTDVPEAIVFSQLAAAQGSVLVSARLHVCLLCPAGTARTFGCTSLPWRITGSGRSRASAWQRGRGTGNLQKPKQREVCTDVYTCAVKYLSSEETVDPSERRASRRCDLPQNRPVFLKLATASAAAPPSVQLGEMTASLWCPGGRWEERGKKPAERTDCWSSWERVAESGYPPASRTNGQE